MENESSDLVILASRFGFFFPSPPSLLLSYLCSKYKLADFTTTWMLLIFPSSLLCMYRKKWPCVVIKGAHCEWIVTDWLAGYGNSCGQTGSVHSIGWHQTLQCIDLFHSFFLVVRLRCVEQTGHPSVVFFCPFWLDWDFFFKELSWTKMLRIVTLLRECIYIYILRWVDGCCFFCRHFQ